LGWFFYLTPKHTKIMKKNMGNADRIIRTLIAVIAAYLYFGGIVTGTWGIVLVVVAAVFLLTSLVSFCPLYTIVGLKTCAMKE
jgi:fatty acid desaturase